MLRNPSASRVGPSSTSASAVAARAGTWPRPNPVTAVITVTTAANNRILDGKGHLEVRPGESDPELRHRWPDPLEIGPEAALYDSSMIYVVLLRGINVGGKAKVPMTALRDVCTAAGCEDVVTYIQSGNVVLTSRLTADKLTTALEGAIAAEFGFSPAVMVRTAKEMAAVPAQNPYAGADENTIHVGFLHAAPDAATKKCLAAIDCAPETVTPVGRDLYLHLPNGMGRAKIPVFVERCLKPKQVTVRNWRTVTKLIELSS
jgi:uncharacterized protein (DUF1697 family)